MARKPIRTNGPRKGGFAVAGSSNQLFESATKGREHKSGPQLDRDYSQNVSNLGWRELLSVGRFLYANCPGLKFAINKIAELAVGNAFLPQYYGANKAWGERAENLLIEWHKVLDVRGAPYDWATDLQLWIKSVLRDGDVSVLFAEMPGTDFPLIQTLPAHRIGGRTWANGLVTGGDYDGSPIINGVIFNDFGRAIAIRVVDPLQTTYTDVSLVNTFDAAGNIVTTADAFMLFDPDWADQARGLSPIAAGANDHKDGKQVKDYLKMALRKEASFAVVEYTETGEVDTAADFSRSGPTTDGTPAATLYTEKTDGGITQVYKAGTGAKVEFPSGNRPSSESQVFWDKVARDGFAAIGWPMEFYDTAGKGGAALRLVMELAAPTIYRAQVIAKQAAARIDGWRIAKAIKSGELPPDPDWWKWEHQTPEEITADKGYSAQIDREDYKLGFTSLRDISSRRGKWIGDLMSEREDEAKELLERAARRASEHNAANPSMPITIDVALSLLRQASANPPQNPATAGTPGEPAATQTEN